MRGSLLSQKHFCSEGIKKLVQRWKKCIEKQGDYVEKRCYCKFSTFIAIKFVTEVRIIIDSPTYVFREVYGLTVPGRYSVSIHNSHFSRFNSTFSGKTTEQSVHRALAAQSTFAQLPFQKDVTQKILSKEISLYLPLENKRFNQLMESH